MLLDRSLEAAWQNSTGDGSGENVHFRQCKHTDSECSRYMNLPICGLSFLILLLFLDVHNPKTPVWAGLRAIDWLGSLALLAVTLMTLLGLNIGGESFDWTSPTVLVLITVGVACSVLFFLIEAKAAKYPVMPLGVFKSSSNSATIAIKFFHAFVCASTLHQARLMCAGVRWPRILPSFVLSIRQASKTPPVRLTWAAIHLP